MDSINKNQPEQNREDLRGDKAIQKIRDLVDAAKTCFFCTTGPSPSRPMNVRQIDDAGNLWFLSASDSHKNAELARDPAVTLYFQGSPHSHFLELHGRGFVSTDRKKIKELWEPVLQTWFTGGVDDPRLTAIQVTPSDGYYWDTKHGDFVAGIKVLVGAVLGQTLDDSIEGKLKV